jgi:uncharacterized protein (TIGR00290 family)
MKEPVVISWSGGKDSVMTLHELLNSDEYEPVSLLTTVSEKYRRISHHGVRESLLDEQAKAINIPLRKVYLPSENGGGCTNVVYESIMKDVMVAYRRDGLRSVAFGDLFLQDLRAWREANLARADMSGIFPLWNRDSRKFAHEVIALGYKALLSCTECRIGAGFVGCEYDEQFLDNLPPGIDHCGENGEFHSFVYDGPIFQRSIPVRVGAIVERDSRQYADLISRAQPVERVDAGAFQPI